MSIRIPLDYRLARSDTPAERVNKLEWQIWYLDWIGNAEDQTVALYKKYVGPPSPRDMWDRIEEMDSGNQQLLIAEMTKLRDRKYNQSRYHERTFKINVFTVKLQL